MTREQGYETLSTEEEESGSTEDKVAKKRVRFEDGTKSEEDESADVVHEDLELQSSESSNISKGNTESSEESGKCRQIEGRNEIIDDRKVARNQNRTPDIATPGSMRKQNKIRQIDLIAVTFLVVTAACLVFFFALKQTNDSVLTFSPSIEMTSSSFPSKYPSLTPTSTSSPTVSPTQSSQPSIRDLREKFLLEKINRASPKSALPSTPIFNAPNRTEVPQIHAAEWLLYEDELNIQEDYFDEEIVDRFVLATLYFATQGKLGQNWLSNASVCEWEGVVCDRKLPHKIKQLSMVNFELKGKIPAEIALLESLTDLFLDHNFLQHTDPALFSLAGLRTLDLSNNELQGTFPTEINMLTNLSDLYLSFNDFTGQLDGLIDINLTRLGKFQMCEINTFYWKCVLMSPYLILPCRNLSPTFQLNYWNSA